MDISTRSEGVPTSRLITEYEYAKQLFLSAEAVLKQRAIDESGFKVGDIVHHVIGDSTLFKRDSTDVIVSRLEGIVHTWYDSTVTLEVKAWALKRTKTGWHSTESGLYQINSERTKPYKGADYWEVVGHEDLPAK